MKSSKRKIFGAIDNITVFISVVLFINWVFLDEYRSEKEGKRKQDFRSNEAPAGATSSSVSPPGTGFEHQKHSMSTVNTCKKTALGSS